MPRRLVAAMHMNRCLESTQSYTTQSNPPYAHAYMPYACMYCQVHVHAHKPPTTRNHGPHPYHVATLASSLMPPLGLPHHTHLLFPPLFVKCLTCDPFSLARMMREC